jgi:uncharacterized iron-regulated membrane protein
MATAARSTQVRLRQAWFQVHKWLGLILAPLVIVVSLTGSALVWHDWVDGAINPQRSASAAPEQAPSIYADAAREALRPGETLLSLTFPAVEGAVIATAARADSPAGRRPVRTQLWLDPADGQVLDRAASNEGAMLFLHVLHGSLWVPGLGRKIVGWIGVAMLASSLTGLWLWWPFKGGFARGLRWKRMPTTSGNLHHQGGFWIALPLAVLSFTGAWISFPAFFGALSGEASGPPRGAARNFNAAPVASPLLTPDGAVDAARPAAAEPLRTLAWPTAPDAQWSVTFGDVRSPFKVHDASGKVTPPTPPPAETTARLMRRIHDGTDMGPVWQTIVFLGGLIPAGLAVTGVMMWLRGRKVRGSVRAAFAARQDVVES